MKGMSRIVKTVATLLYGFIAVFGFYIIIHGHLTPGGGFQGGAVVASAFALLLVSYGNLGIKKYIKKDILSIFESVGLILFITIAFLGLGVTFFYNFMANSGGIFGNQVVTGINPGDLNTGGTVAAMNIAVGLEVLAALGVIVLIMSAGSEIKDKKETS
ncbi:MAG: sodium:proton antiporter [Candidatus Atribacteria bacterium]|nr:sodium:proton antiporter [Candidatus Atribacteria bacterium]